MSVSSEQGYKPHKYVFGRPREHDRDAIGQALVDWSQKPDSINLCKFCALEGLPPSYLTKWANECDYFSKAYEYAKTNIGARREEMLNMELLHVKAYDLNAKTYDYFLDEKFQKNAQFEASLSNKENTTYTPEDKAKIDNINNQISSMADTLKSSRINKSKEM